MAVIVNHAKASSEFKSFDKPCFKKQEGGGLDDF